MIATVLLVAALFQWAAAVTLGLCSTQNSASSFFPVSNQYMSNGYCSDTCASQGYSYAVVQEYSCWCTNGLPSGATAAANCDTDCPGYPVEKCASQGYFGYINLRDPDSLIELPSSSQPSTASPSSSAAQASAQVSSASARASSSSAAAASTSRPSRASSSTDPAASLGSTTPASAAASTPAGSASLSDDTNGSGSSSSGTASSEMAPTTIYSTKTVNGTPTQIVRTEFITTVPTSQATQSESSSGPATSGSRSSFFDSKGKVAGTFTAVGVVVVGLVVGILWCCCCAKRSDSNDDYTDEENQSSSDDSLKMSTPKTQANSLRRDNSSKSLFTMLTTKDNRDVGGLSRNLSKKRLNPINDVAEMPMFPISELDPRLDTFFLNGNQSAQTFGDEQDYSRKLKITNPDSLS